MNNLEFQNSLDRIKGLTVAIVYIFEGEQAAGFAHYHIWKGDIISKWLNAIANVGCRPFILDVRTFVEKAFSNTLPHIDFVINLNCGSTDLDPMAIVPSTCAFLGIPCIPCGSFSILAGENKYHSNLLAKECGLLVSPTCEASDPNGIFRPLNWGSSLGVVRGKCPTAQKGIYQKFIKGFDITTPAIFNPLTENFDFLPTIVYVPKNQDINWFFALFLPVLLLCVYGRGDGGRAWNLLHLRRSGHFAGGGQLYRAGTGAGTQDGQHRKRISRL